MIYLDNAATTPVSKEVLDAMLPYFSNSFGNPSAIYSLGSEAKRAIEKARRQVATAINAEPNQIIFTSNATESNILAMHNRTTVSSNMEHHSISLAANSCAKTEDFLTDDFYEGKKLYTHLLVNNEVGQIYDIKKMCKLAHKNKALFHTDATAAFGKVPIDVKDINVDFLTFTGHKIHSLKGCSVLYAKNPSLINPIFLGSQERGFRAGTENVPAIVGIGKACELYNYSEEQNANNVEKRDILVRELSNIPDMRFNTDLKHSIPTTLNVSFKSVESESLMLLLNNYHVYVSAGSACASGSIEPSAVLKALKVPDDYIYGTIRISFSNNTTIEELCQAAQLIAKCVAQIR